MAIGTKSKHGWLIRHQKFPMVFDITLHSTIIITNALYIGFDNAHAVKSKKKGLYRGRIVEYDHVHETPHDKGTHYEFINAEQLLKEFLTRVNQIIEEANKR